MEKTLADLIDSALSIRGAHHKQWYLIQIADLVGVEVEDHHRIQAIAP